MITHFRPINLQNHLCLRLLSALIFFSVVGCGKSNNLDSSYARTNGKSINGVSSLKEVLESRGHEVKAAWGLDEEVFDSAHVIIRLADRPGPPGSEEAKWYDGWLLSDNTNLLIYAPGRADWTVNYWQQAVEKPDPSWDEDRKSAYKRNLNRARTRSDLRKPAAKNPPQSPAWFKTEKIDNGKVVMPIFEWFGEWSGEGMVWPVKEVLNFPPGHSLLKYREKPVVTEYGQRLYLANAGFFLNGGLVHPGNRQLTEKLIDWLEEQHPDCLVVIVAGDDPMADPDEGNALWKFLTTWPSSTLAAHLIILGLLGCWCRAIRRGPAREPETRQWQQFSLHAKAVGRLLEKSSDLQSAATDTFERYAKWRSLSAVRLWEKSLEEDNDNVKRS